MRLSVWWVFLTELQTLQFPIQKETILSSFTYLVIYSSRNCINSLPVISLSCQPKLEGITQMSLIPAENLLLKCLRLLLKIIIFYEAYVNKKQTRKMRCKGKSRKCKGILSAFSFRIESAEIKKKADYLILYDFYPWFSLKINNMKFQGDRLEMRLLNMVPVSLVSNKQRGRTGTILYFKKEGLLRFIPT